MKNKLCFVVMGFGRKHDPTTGRMIDLDATYNKIIQPAIAKSGCECIRADEIIGSSIIDKSMYALLYYADIVIADISTYNPNAIYELGVRHSLRPFSTIIIKEDSGEIPFDIGHNRILSYNHLGNDISDAEAKKSSGDLSRLIKRVLNSQEVDSPLYSYFSSAKKPNISDEEINSIMDQLSNNEDSIYCLTNKAKTLMNEGNFKDAAAIWERLSTKVVNEKYYIQQQALCVYKSEGSSKLSSLIEALVIIDKINEPTDSESLGIRGAICKRIWEISKDEVYLNKAIDAYGKVWKSFGDFYNGENYANCMYMKSCLLNDIDRKTHARVEAEIVQDRLIELLPDLIDKEDNQEVRMWMCASLSNSYLARGHKEKANKFEALFREHNPVKWQIDTFEETKKLYQKQMV